MSAPDIKPVFAAALVVTWAKLGPFQTVGTPVDVRLALVQVVDLCRGEK